MKKNMYFCLAIVLMASCSQNELPGENNRNALVEVKLSSSAVSADVSTRASITGTTFTNTTTQVLVTDRAGAYVSASDKLFHDGTMTFNGVDVVGFATKQYYPKTGLETVFLCGLYPTGWTIDGGTKANRSFNNTEDAMFATEVSNTKILAQAGTHAKLTFKHLLTNLIIKAKAESADADIKTAIDGKWGKIKSITLTSTTNTKVEVPLAGNAGAAVYTEPAASIAIDHQASGKVHPFVCGDVAFTNIVIPDYVADNANLEAIAYALTSPLAGTLTFSVETEKGGTVTTSATLIGTGNANQGKYCVVTLTFKVLEIKASATITDWEAGEDVGAAEIE